MAFIFNSSRENGEQPLALPVSQVIAPDILRKEAQTEGEKSQTGTGKNNARSLEWRWLNFIDVAADRIHVLQPTDFPIALERLHFPAYFASRWDHMIDFWLMGCGWQSWMLFFFRCGHKTEQTSISHCLCLPLPSPHPDRASRSRGLFRQQWSHQIQGRWSSGPHSGKSHPQELPDQEKTTLDFSRTRNKHLLGYATENWRLFTITLTWSVRYVA